MGLGAGQGLNRNWCCPSDYLAWVVQGGPTRAQGQRPTGLEVGQGAKRQEGTVVMVMWVLVPLASESPLAPHGVSGFILIHLVGPARCPLAIQKRRTHRPIPSKRTDLSFWQVHRSSDCFPSLPIHPQLCMFLLCVSSSFWTQFPFSSRRSGDGLILEFFQ